MKTVTRSAGRERLVALWAVMAAISAVALLFSMLVPLIWHEKFYIDGLTIAHSEPALHVFGSSFNSAAFLLQPWLALASALGGDVFTYGTGSGSGLLVTNAVFGFTFLVIVAWFAVKFSLRVTWRNIGAFSVILVVLAPFYFCITKELITFLAALAPWVMWSRKPGKVYAALLVYAAAMVFLGLYFRTYYLLYVAIFFFNLLAFRRMKLAVLVYGVILMVIFFLFDRLPLDLVMKGRAEYLEGVSASRIEYYLSDKSFFGFVGNRVLTFVSMMFPINLLLRSMAYAPFVILQSWLGYKVLLNLYRHVGGVAGISTHAVLAFTIIQALFEPDYGSYFRHRVGILLFMFVLLCDFKKISGSGRVTPKCES